MITEFFIWLIGSIVQLVGGWIPTSDPSGAVSGATTGIGYVLGFVSGFGVWLPFDVVGACVAILLAVVAVGFTIRLVRIVASFFTGGGGSAA